MSPETASARRTPQEQARHDAAKSHCDYFKKYYIAIIAFFVLAFFTLIVAPRELREGDRGCSGGCGSDTSDCCIFSESSVCSGRCFCSVRDSNDAWYCRDKKPTLGGAAIAFFSIFFAAAWIAVFACLCKLQERKNRGMVDNPTSDTIVTCSANKATRTTKMGVCFRRDDAEHELYVSDIDPNSPFQGTLMRLGMTVNKINETWVGGKTLAEATKIMTDVPAGKVVITGKVSPATHARRQRLLEEGNGDGGGAATMPASLNSAGTTSTTTNEKLFTSTTGGNGAPKDGKVRKSIAAVVQKDSPDQKLGVRLGLDKNKGIFIITDLSDDSPFLRQTALREGMQVTTINGFPLEGKDMDFAMSILRGAAGTIIIAAETEYDPSEPPKSICIARVSKSYPEEKLGITLGLTSATGVFHVAKMTSDSPFAETDLEVGMEVKKINDIKLKGQPMKVAMMLLKEATDITIVAEGAPPPVPAQPVSSGPAPYVPAVQQSQNTTQAPPHRAPYVQPRSSSEISKPEPTAPPPVPHIVATATKDTADQKLGITLTRDANGYFTISNLSPSSPFSIMGLAEGMKVVSINNIEITGQEMTLATMLLRDSVGEVTITAEEPHSGHSEQVPAPAPAAAPRPQARYGEPDTELGSNSAPFGGGEGEGGSEEEGMGIEVVPSSGGAAGSAPMAEAQLISDPTAATSRENMSMYSAASEAPVTSKIVVTKNSRDDKLGIAMKRDPARDGGAFTISSIAPDSPFQSTNLKVGMRVMGINGIEITGQEMSFIMTILKSSVGQVVLETTEEDNEEWC